MNPALARKITDVFGGMTVDKTQALSVGFERMPRFVTEFLLARARGASIDLNAARERIQRHAIDADRKDVFLSRLMTAGGIHVIALLEVTPRPDKNAHLGHIAQLDGHELFVPEAIIEEYPELLYGGLWGSIALHYELGTRAPRIMVTAFTPYQLTAPDLDLFRDARAAFSRDEWLELLLQSAGYRGAALPTLRQKLLLLARLVPLCQPSVNLIELGPRGTGKSYLLRSLSPRAFVLSGARATPAALLYDLSRRQVGIVGRKKVVIFDEVGATDFPDRSLVAALKDYMESGHISRGGRDLCADCSLVFAGNLDLDADTLLPQRGYPHLLAVLPRELRDAALADRLHGFVPGWELPKIRDEVLADGPALLSDYFGEVLCALRGQSAFQDHVRRWLRLSGGATIRDRTAIERLLTGLVKLVHPDLIDQPDAVTDGDLLDLAAVAIELRQRIHFQLCRMAPGEYAPRSLLVPGLVPTRARDLEEAPGLEDRDEAINDRPQLGLVTALRVAGPVLVECVHVDGAGLGVLGGRGGYELSARTAYDCLLSLGRTLGLSSERLRGKRTAVQVRSSVGPGSGPGERPEDLGLACALAILSAASGRPLRPGLAVTGGLTIQGQVCESEDLGPRLDSARRHGRRLVLVPAAQAAEAEALRHKRTDLDDLEIRPVATLQEAAQLALHLVSGVADPMPNKGPQRTSQLASAC